MNAAISNLDTDQVCPYLGLAGDPATHYAQPSGALQERVVAGHLDLVIDRAHPRIFPG